MERILVSHIYRTKLRMHRRKRQRRSDSLVWLLWFMFSTLPLAYIVVDYLKQDIVVEIFLERSVDS